MSSSILHRANERGHANHGWLNAHHSFSFASYYDESKIHFGALRVLNDDEVAPGMGFGTHPHDNMEIITIPLSGDLQHRDSMGNVATINEGYIQVMSAGTGIQHSEYNPNKDKALKLLQIWIMPNERNVQPRYGEIQLPESTDNRWQQIVSPNTDDEGTWIHQNAWLHIGQFEAGQKTDYTVKAKENGVYVFVIEGKVTLNGETLNKRDAMGLWNTEGFHMEIEDKSKVLLLDVPMIRLY
ncbi:MAG: pirin family protein [Bacteroidota bacterium]